MAFWDAIKRIGRSISSGVGRILDVGKNVRSIAGKVWTGIRNIPVIGNIADSLASKPIIGGMSAKDLAGRASDALDTADRINSAVSRVVG